MSEKPSPVAIRLAASAFALAFVFSALALFFVFARAAIPPSYETAYSAYRVRLSAVPGDMAQLFRVGDPVNDSVTKNPLGSVTAIEIRPTPHESIIKGHVVTHEDPRLKDITLTLSVPLTENAATTWGYLIRAGKTIYLRMPSYQGGGTCLGVLFSEDA